MAARLQLAVVAVLAGEANPIFITCGLTKPNPHSVSCGEPLSRLSGRAHFALALKSARIQRHDNLWTCVEIGVPLGLNFQTNQKRVASTKRQTQTSFSTFGFLLLLDWGSPYTPNLGGLPWDVRGVPATASPPPGRPAASRESRRGSQACCGGRRWRRRRPRPWAWPWSAAWSTPPGESAIRVSFDELEVILP